MTPALEYQTPERRVPAPWLAVIMLIAGCAALLFGGFLAFLAGSSLRKAPTDPIESLGPGAYVVDVLEGLVYLALVLVPAGALLVLMGWRRLRSGRMART
jgi:hypothetical protein